MSKVRSGGGGSVMGSLESRIGHGVSTCGDQCMDHAVSALLTCKAVLKALWCPGGPLQESREEKEIAL